MADAVFGCRRHLSEGDGPLYPAQAGPLPSEGRKNGCENRISSESSLALWSDDRTIDRSGDAVCLLSISITDVTGRGCRFVFVVCEETISAECSFVLEHPFDEWSGKLSECVEDKWCIFDEKRSLYSSTFDGSLDFVLDDFKWIEGLNFREISIYLLDFLCENRLRFAELVGIASEEGEHQKQGKWYKLCKREW